MSGRIHRQMQGQVRHVAAEQAKAMAPAIKAALDNEQITRKRVDAIEAWCKEAETLWARPFLGRLKWLFTGR